MNLQNLQLIALDSEILSSIWRCIETAQANPISRIELHRALALQEEPGKGRAASKVVIPSPPYNVSIWFALEQQEIGLCRHVALSIRDDNGGLTGKCIHPFMAQLILPWFGFNIGGAGNQPRKVTASIWTEDTCQVVNVLQKIEDGAPVFKSRDEWSPMVAQTLQQMMGSQLTAVPATPRWQPTAKTPQLRRAQRPILFR